MAIIPGMTDLTRPYWDAAPEGRLVVQQCRACVRAWHPPLPVCPHCNSADPGWREVAGTGTVYTYTVVRHPTHIALADQVPYVIAIVELTEGPRVVTGITGCDPGDVRAGMPVRVTFTAVSDDVTLPYFEPAVSPPGGRPPCRPPGKGGETPLSPPSPGEPAQIAGPWASRLPGWGRPLCRPRPDPI